MQERKSELISIGASLSRFCPVGVPLPTVGVPTSTIVGEALIDRELVLFLEVVERLEHTGVCRS